MANINIMKQIWIFNYFEKTVAIKWRIISVFQAWVLIQIYIKTINVLWKCENQESTENVKIENQPKNYQNMGTLKTNLRIHWRRAKAHPSPFSSLQTQLEIDERIFKDFSKKKFETNFDDFWTLSVQCCSSCRAEGGGSGQG